MVRIQSRQLPVLAPSLQWGLSRRLAPPTYSLHMSARQTPERRHPTDPFRHYLYASLRRPDMAPADWDIYSIITPLSPALHGVSDGMVCSLLTSTFSATIKATLSASFDAEGRNHSLWNQRCQHGYSIRPWCRQVPANRFGSEQPSNHHVHDKRKRYAALQLRALQRTHGCRLYHHRVTWFLQ